MRWRPPPSSPSAPTRLADGVAPPGPDEVTGVGVVGETADEADRLATACLGLSEPVS